MEQIYKRAIPSRQKDRLTDVQCGVLASGDFARLTKEVKKFLGLAKQKALYC